MADRSSPRIAELEIETFTADFGRQQHVDSVLVILGQREATAEIGSIIVRDVAMNQTNAQAGTSNIAIEIGQRV